MIARLIRWFHLIWPSRRAADESAARLTSAVMDLQEELSKWHAH